MSLSLIVHEETLNLSCVGTHHAEEREHIPCLSGTNRQVLNRIVFLHGGANGSVSSTTETGSFSTVEFLSVTKHAYFARCRNFDLDEVPFSHIVREVSVQTGRLPLVGSRVAASRANRQCCVTRMQTIRSIPYMRSGEDPHPSPES